MQYTHQCEASLLHFFGSLMLRSAFQSVQMNTREKEYFWKPA